MEIDMSRFRNLHNLKSKAPQKEVKKEAPKVTVTASGTKDGEPFEMEEQTFHLDPVESDGTSISLGADIGNSVQYGKESFKVHASITLPTTADEICIERSYADAREIIFKQLKQTRAYGIEALDLKLIEE